MEFCLEDSCRIISDANEPGKEKKKQEAEKRQHSIKIEYKRVMEKEILVRQSFTQAVTGGTRSESGRLVMEFSSFVEPSLNQFICMLMIKRHYHIKLLIDLIFQHKSLHKKLGNGTSFTSAAFSIGLISCKNSVFNSHSGNDKGCHVLNGLSVIIELWSLKILNLLQYDIQYFKGEFSILDNIMKLTISPHPTKQASPIQSRRDLSVRMLISFR